MSYHNLIQILEIYIHTIDIHSYTCIYSFHHHHHHPPPPTPEGGGRYWGARIQSHNPGVEGEVPGMLAHKK